MPRELTLLGCLDKRRFLSRESDLPDERQKKEVRRELGVGGNRGGGVCVCVGGGGEGGKEKNANITDCKRLRYFVCVELITK